MGFQGKMSRVQLGSASRLHAAFKAAIAIALSLGLAMPQVAHATQWSFNPQERYQTGLKAFEVGEYKLAIELWMDVLANPEAIELEARMIQLIGENVVSAFESALKPDPEDHGLLVEAGEFCSLYTERHSTKAFSQIVVDACVDWPERSFQEQRASAKVQGGDSASALSLISPEPAEVPPQPMQRSISTKIGLGLLFGGLAAGATGLTAMVAEGSWIQRYHAGLDAGSPDLQLRKGAESWRTIAVVSAGLGVSLVAFGAVLCVLGTKRGQDPSELARRRGAKRWALGASGLGLRF